MAANPDTQQAGRQTVAHGSGVAAWTVVHSIRGITAVLGWMSALGRAARPPEPTSSLAVRHRSLHAATKVTVDGRITPSTSASEPRVRAFHARGSSVMCPLSSAPFRLHIPPVGLVICGLTPSPRGVSLPHATAWVLALLQRYSLRSRAHDRPHVSLSEALLSAFASCGIPPDTPCGWHLLPSRRESTYRVTPFPVPIVRIRRTVLSTGFLWQCMPVSGFGCRRPILCLLAPACQPLALGYGYDGSSHLRLRCP